VGLHRRIVVVAIAPLLVFEVGACRRSPQPLASVVVTTSSASSVNRPDRLAEGELPPGVDRAFDLALPRGTRIDRSFPDRIYASVPLSTEQSANWLRRQYGELEATIGAAGTLLPRIQPSNASDGHWLRVEISLGNNGDSIWMVDRIESGPPIKDPPKSNEEAMRRAGLTPSGALLNPLKQE
jgi:hypothetical protein